MFRKNAIGLAIMLIAGAVYAQNSLQGEVELKAATRTERDAGVWLDGQYVGFVREMRGNDRLVLVPGPHEFLFKLIGYQDLAKTIVVEPGRSADYRVSMVLKPDVTFPAKENTAQVRIDIEPEDAAIFVNDAFVGHVDRFNGRRGMRMAPGTYRFTVALPGYESFQTELTVRANQTYELKTDLSRGRLSDQAAQLIATRPGAPPKGN
jgi:hypothetical protein